MPLLLRIGGDAALRNVTSYSPPSLGGVPSLPEILSEAGGSARGGGGN